MANGKIRHAIFTALLRLYFCQPFFCQPFFCQPFFCQPFFCLESETIIKVTRADVTLSFPLFHFDGFLDERLPLKLIRFEWWIDFDFLNGHFFDGLAVNDHLAQNDGWH